MKSKFVIIGGGVAGLCTAIRLAELGEEPLVLEGGSYPTHKICGEFLSPECIHFLAEWHIYPVAISEVVLSTPSNHLVFPFPSLAGGMSHMQLDPALAKYASLLGAKILTNTQVASLQPKKHPKDVHRIELSNRDSIEASNVIIATGRLPNYVGATPLMLYAGIKAHFDHISSEVSRLHMFSFPGAYLGISPVEDNKFNVACLVELGKTKDIDPASYIQSLIDQNPNLHSLLFQGRNIFDKWMVASLPAFGVKQTPDWLDAYFIGDAAISVPPACGNGLSMAIFGGRLAAEYSVRQQPHHFKSMWTKRCFSQLAWANRLHKLMLNPCYCDPLLRLTRRFPVVGRKIFELTRQPF